MLPVKWYAGKPIQIPIHGDVNWLLQQEIYIIACKWVLMNPESRVMVRGVTLDDRITFNEHVSVRRSKVARQLNA